MRNSDGFDSCANPVLTDYRSIAALVERNGHAVVTTVLRIFGERHYSCYTVGGMRAFGTELCVVGPQPQLMAAMLLNALRQPRSLRDRTVLDGVLSGASCFLRAVPVSLIAKLYPYAVLYAKSSGVTGPSMLQVVWPEKCGFYPWDDESSLRIRNAQPILCMLKFEGVPEPADENAPILNQGHCDALCPYLSVTASSLRIQGFCGRQRLIFDNNSFCAVCQPKLVGSAGSRNSDQDKKTP